MLAAFLCPCIYKQTSGRRQDKLSQTPKQMIFNTDSVNITFSFFLATHTLTDKQMSFKTDSVNHTFSILSSTCTQTDKQMIFKTNSVNRTCSFLKSACTQTDKQMMSGTCLVKCTCNFSLPPPNSGTFPTSLRLRRMVASMSAIFCRSPMAKALSMLWNRRDSSVASCRNFKQVYFGK